MSLLAELPLSGLAAALGLGLLIGLVRERSGHPALIAGLRTHALTALGGALAFWMGLPVFVVALLLVGLLVVIGYRRTLDEDPGLTGEMALLLTLLLAVLLRFTFILSLVLISLLAVLTLLAFLPFLLLLLLLLGELFFELLELLLHVGAVGHHTVVCAEL